MTFGGRVVYLNSAKKKPRLAPGNVVGFLELVADGFDDKIKVFIATTTEVYQ